LQFYETYYHIIYNLGSLMNGNAEFEPHSLTPEPTF
jgi:hypothetical protein